ncbi:MAG: hypothetical protein C4K49_10565 [Candidatus Thorarchaeota archaeon]|nr:MAG: hypothetical protein C4K49_10565 [Candidatus Thorarchaeota archaeon]
MNRAGKAAGDQREEAKKMTAEQNKPEVNETLKKLLSGEDLFETVETDRGTFTIKYPRPKVLRQIQVLLAQRFDDVNLGNIAPSTLRFYEIYATLDIVIVKAPQWWDDLDSSEDCPDDKLIGDLYRRYLRFYNRIQSEIGGAGAGSGKEPPAGASGTEKADVVAGAFSGIAHDEGVPGADGRTD